MRDPNRVVFVLTHYGVGGAEKQLANLIRYRPARARDLDVRTITFLPTSSADVERRFAEAGAKNVLVDRSALSFPRFFLALLSQLRALRPVMVSTILDSSVGAWGRLAAILTGVPIIVHSDRLLATEGSRAHFLLRPHLDRRTRRFLPNATAIADRLAADGVPRAKIVVVPNGVDLSVFDPDTAVGSRPDLGISDDAVVLGYLGRFAPFKRVDLLIEAISALDEKDRPDYVVLAGDGPTMPLVRSLVDADPWLREHCKFLGTINDTPSFLSTIDYLVLPSESEGLPNVVLEAMAMRRPVVSTNVSDIPVLVGDTGFIVEPSNRAALSEAILQMQALGKNGRIGLGNLARARIEREYSIEVAAERFWNAHLELLDAYRSAKRTGTGS